MAALDSLDSKTLQRYLEQHLDGFCGPLSAEKFSGGQSNPTFKITAASGQYVLRRQPPGKLLKSAHAVDREYRVLKALQHSDVPVAQVYHLCQDPSVIGCLFYIMEYCPGQVYWNPALPELPDNAARRALYDTMNRTLAAIHKVDLASAELTDYGKPGNYFERQYARWAAQYHACALQNNPSMDTLITWLGNNLPADDDRITLVHGDFRLDNLMFAPKKTNVIAVLDWELSTLGHPFADISYQCMHLRMPQGLGALDGLQGIDRESLGIPTEQDYVARYCKRMGLPEIAYWEFYLAFSFFRLAAIAQGVAKRATLGNASNARAAKMGQYVDPLANMALDIIRNGA